MLVDDPMLAEAGNDVTCPSGALLPGKSVTCTASYTVTQADVDAGLVRNEATAAATTPAEATVVSNLADAEVPADGTEGLALVKTGVLVDGDGDGLADKGEIVDYTFEVTNTGNVTLSDVAVSDPKLEAVPVAVTCPGGPVLPGDSVHLHRVVRRHGRRREGRRGRQHGRRDRGPHRRG